MVETLSPRDRLLETASRLFYAEGIHTVGVDKLVTVANVTRATFYRHFPTKEDLVVAYLRARDVEMRETVAERVAAASRQKTMLAVLDFVGDYTCSPGFRGCPFINAAAEYPDPTHPVRLAVSDHRRWFRETLAGLAADAGHPEPDYVADVLFLLHDGALQGGELDDPQAVRATLFRAARELLGLTDPATS
ncbi:MAG: transcriptional regulator, TetR family [Amycolatopsis sp.]|jgi:AcrR family transcriptional regulator|uniref:TetR/AcrR family transcriptional regulator n=1 Tax=Amycolatopsis sp. TaxID=37632 RepID=UPI00262FCAD3|nr:TetR/AcrR family transcriptional regulator [Amycolatopsis sp.]MCU1683735.1 transcriptional regulator, TetR family [Amycolatopsis sp.]